MPLQPNGGKFYLPIESEADMYTLLEKAREIFVRQTGRLTREHYRADVADHFYYVGALHPDYFRPLQEEIVQLPLEELKFFSLTFETWCNLLFQASDRCVEYLEQRLWSDQSYITPSLYAEMLAAVGTPPALQILAAYADQKQMKTELELTGFWFPGGNQPAEPRFSRSQSVVHVRPFEGNTAELLQCTHPVGLPVSQVVEEAYADLVTWHYVTFDTREIVGMPQGIPSRLPLVSPPLYGGWTLLYSLTQDGRITRPELKRDERHIDESDSELIEKLRDEAQEYQDQHRGQVLLLPYNDQLIYRNGHVLLTEGVVGTMGGPPIGLYASPYCPTCSKLMFHVCTVENKIREYGDGFRSLFVCERCAIVASHATSWN